MFPNSTDKVVVCNKLVQFSNKKVKYLNQVIPKNNHNVNLDELQSHKKIQYKIR